MYALTSDLSYAARLWIRRPGSLAAAVMALALAIGACTIVFSVVSAVLLRPLPYREPDRLVMIWQDMRARGGPEREWASPGHFNDWRQRSTSFSQVAAVRGWAPTLTGVSEPERLRGAAVSHGYLAGLGVAPELGRVFSEDDDQPGGPAVAVISHGLWKRRFGADPAVVGRTASLDGQPTVIIGVMPASFRPAIVDADIFSPARINPAGAPRGMIVLRVFARLADGVTLAQAQSELNAIATQVGSEDPDWRGTRIVLVPLHEDVVGSVRPVLFVLTGAVALVLLIACANVASLLLARASERGREMTIRAALGAGRGRLVRQLLAESALLAGLGGAIGLVLAWWGLQWLVASAPASAPRLQEVRLDGGILAFSVAVSLAVAVVAGLAPAASVSRVEMAPALRDGGREHTRGSRVRSAMVVFEVMVAMALVVGAGLLVRSLVALQRVDLGFTGERVMTASIAPPRGSYRGEGAMRALYTRVLGAARALPGVESAALTSILPLAGMDTDFTFEIPGRGRARTPGDQPSAWFRIVSADYFSVMGMRILEGRAFSNEDRTGGAAVVAVNETLARRYWPGTSPLGQRVSVENQEATIVAIVADVHQRGPSVPPQAEMFLPLDQFSTRAAWVVLKARDQPAALVPALRQMMRDIDPNIPLAMATPMDGLVDRSVAQARFVAMLLTAFAGLAAGLALVGVYSVLSFSVNRRVREIGVRMALGAQRRSVVRLVMRQSLVLVCAGLAAGALLSALLSRFMETLLFQVEPGDPATIGIMACLIGVAAAAASYGPARRASRIDPIVAIRED